MPPFLCGAAPQDVVHGNALCSPVPVRKTAGRISAPDCKFPKRATRRMIFFYNIRYAVARVNTVPGK